MIQLSVSSLCTANCVKNIFLVLLSSSSFLVLFRLGDIFTSVEPGLGDVIRFEGVVLDAPALAFAAQARLGCSGHDVFRLRTLRLLLSLQRFIDHLVRPLEIPEFRTIDGDKLVARFGPV